MENEKLKTLKELIDSFDLKYYDNVKKVLIRRIADINKSPNTKQARAEIERINKSIKDNDAEKKEVEDILLQLNMSANKLEAIAEKNVLLTQLNNFLISRKHIEMGNTDIYEENKKKYSKLYLISDKKIQESKQKISKELYELIMAKKLRAVTSKVYKSEYTVGQALTINRISIAEQKDPGDIIFSEARKSYRNFPHFDDIRELGVDIITLQQALDKTKGPLNFDSLTWNGQNVFHKLEAIKTAKEMHINTKVKESKLSKIEEKYTELAEFSREIWYLQRILIAFQNTTIINTEMYKGLEQLVRVQELELNKLISETDKLYEKIGLQNKIDLIEQLEELYNKSEELRTELEKFKELGNVRQVYLIEPEYEKVRYEMIKILRDNPDLNNPKYKINVENVIKKEMKLFESEIKQAINKEEPSYTKANEEEVFIDKTNVEEQKNTNYLELDSNLQTHRTFYYQDYMREKVLNSALGKLPFSGYLESVAPQLTELIKIEKERESLAKTIYKDYLKYYSSLENKEYAVEFYKFASNNYGVNNMDVPVEYEEEYKEMRKR